jgi:type I restriction enzyme S subunit
VASTTPGNNLLPILRANNIQNGSVILDDFVYIPAELIKSEQLIKKHDILVAMSSGSKNLVGKAGIAKSDFNGGFGTFCGVLRPLGALDARYVGWFTRTKYYSDLVSSLSKGVNINNLKPSHFSEITAPIAPLNEQNRIADKLDSILAKIDKAQERLDIIPGILKRFRQSVLAAATSGELTKEWREQNGILLSDWEDKIFSELLLKIRSGSGVKPTDGAEGVAILRSSAVRNLAIDYADVRYLPEGKAIKSQDYLANDDLLFTRLSGSIEYVGNCARVHGINENAIQYPDRLFCATLKNKSYSRYLEIYFSSPKFGQYIASTIKSSAGHQRITIGVLNNAVIKLPSIQEQKRIVKMVNDLFAHATVVENKYLNIQNKVDRLTQSVLAMAFSGELVMQDHNDEPAQKLLDWINEDNSRAKGKKK